MPLPKPFSQISFGTRVSLSHITPPGAFGSTQTLIKGIDNGVYIYMAQDVGISREAAVWL